MPRIYLPGEVGGTQSVQGNRSMRITHVVPRIDKESSGLSNSVVPLCRFLQDSGIEVDLAVLNSLKGRTTPGFVRPFATRGAAARLGRSPDMRKWLFDSARNSRIDLMHNHSLWMMPNVYSCNAVKGTDIPLVVSPHGTLSKWAMNSGSKVKKLFWPLLQRPALAATSCFHATSEAECADIRRMGFDQPVAIVPNGIELPELPKTGRGNERTLLFLGRIHPIKGLDMLLSAWAAIQHGFPEWKLRIVGPDNGGHLAEMKKLARRLGLKRIEFAGPLSGREKWPAYAEADLFVLPTYSENFGMSVAEALAAGTPAIVTTAAPWSGLTENGAGWWIEVGTKPLVACLEQALSRSRAELDTMGQRGRLWMKVDFSWELASDRMRTVYEWLVNGGPAPSCIHVG